MWESSERMFRCVVADTMSSSPRSSVSSSGCHSTPSDDLPTDRNPSTTSSDHPLNLTKRTTHCVAPEGEGCGSPSRAVHESHLAPNVGLLPSPLQSGCLQTSSFSLKTSPSKFLGSPVDRHRRGGPRSPRSHLDGWSKLQLGVGPPPPPGCNDSGTALMMSTSPAIDRVPVIFRRYTRVNTDCILFSCSRSLRMYSHLCSD